MSLAIATREAGQLERPTLDLAEIKSIGEIFVKSGFFADAKDASQAIVKVMAGAELGFGPMASMTGIYIVKGKVSLSANLMAAAVKRSQKYNFEVKTINAEVCRIEFFEGKKSLGISEFTMKEAKEAKLHQEYDKDKKEWKDKIPWKNFPRNMLFARAMSNGVRWYCADIFAGPTYTPDELDIEENENGEPAKPIRSSEPEEIKPTPRSEPKNITPKTAPPSAVASGPLGGLDAELLKWAIKDKRSEKAGQAYFDGFISKMSPKDRELFAAEKGVKFDEAEGDRQAQGVIDAEIIEPAGEIDPEMSSALDEFEAMRQSLIDAKMSAEEVQNEVRRLLPEHAADVTECTPREIDEIITGLNFKLQQKRNS